MYQELHNARKVDSFQKKNISEEYLQDVYCLTGTGV